MESYGNIRIPWNGWRIESRLGSGSFGTVYEIVRDTYGTVEKSAMKVISVPENSERLNDLYSSGLDDESLSTWCTNRIENILKEYGVMNSLKGKANIVNCEDIEVVPHENDPGADIFIRMELLTSLNKLLGIIQKKEDKLTDDEKETLRKLRPDHKEFTEEDVIKLGKDISQALEICEKNNIVHRDIKPENILISDDGDFKLGDFGTARKMEHTTAATLAGTERYMAPEVIKGGQTGRDVDTYSLGLVMYRLLNRGRFPFYPLTGIPTAEQTEEAQRRRLAGEPFDPPVDGSPELKALVMKACSYDRNDRFSSAAEMMEKIEEAEEIAVARTEHPDNSPAENDIRVESGEDAWTDDSEKTLGSQPISTSESLGEQIGADEKNAGAGSVSDAWNDPDVTLAGPKDDVTDTADTLDEFIVGDAAKEAQAEPAQAPIETSQNHGSNKGALSNNKRLFIIAACVFLAIILGVVGFIISRGGEDFVDTSSWKSYEWDGVSIMLPPEANEISRADMWNYSDDETCKEWRAEQEDCDLTCYIKILDRDHNELDYYDYFYDGMDAFIEKRTSYAKEHPSEYTVLNDTEIEIDGVKCYLFEECYNNDWYQTYIWIPMAEGKWITEVQIWDAYGDGHKRTYESVVRTIVSKVKIKTDNSGVNGFETTAEDIWRDTKKYDCDGISFQIPAGWYAEYDRTGDDLVCFPEYDDYSDCYISVDTYYDYAYGEYEKYGSLQHIVDSNSEAAKKNYEVSEIETGQISIGGNPAWFMFAKYNNDSTKPHTSHYNYKCHYYLYTVLPDKKQVTEFHFECDDKGMYTDRDLQLLEYIKQSIRLSD